LYVLMLGGFQIRDSPLQHINVPWIEDRNVRPALSIAPPACSQGFQDVGAFVDTSPCVSRSDGILECESDALNEPTLLSIVISRALNEERVLPVLRDRNWKINKSSSHFGIAFRERRFHGRKYRTSSKRGANGSIRETYRPETANFGHQRAISAGFVFCSREMCGLMDADCRTNQKFCLSCISYYSRRNSICLPPYKKPTARQS